MTSESMREFFSQFGKVVDSTVMLDRETGRSKGFGFISFEDTDVTPFLGFGQLEIDGKLVRIPREIMAHIVTELAVLRRLMSSSHNPALSAMPMAVHQSTVLTVPPVVGAAASPAGGVAHT